MPSVTSGSRLVPWAPWRLEHIRRYDGPPIPFPKHNAVLKLIRSECEDADGNVTNWGGVDVTKGWHFPDEDIVWMWQTMLQLMADQSLQYVVKEGILEVWCRPMHPSYDFRRHHVKRKEEISEICTRLGHEN